MNVKTKLGRAAGIAVAAMGMATLGLAGAASASTAQPAGNPTVGPQTCSIQTINGHYLTAVVGGGRTTDVIHTDATRVGAWEKFTLIDSGDGSPVIHYGLRTSAGYFRGYLPSAGAEMSCAFRDLPASSIPTRGANCLLFSALGHTHAVVSTAS